MYPAPPRGKIAYVSPHFDDMAYSNGGVLRILSLGLALNEIITVVNVFTRSRYSAFGSGKDPDEITSTRKREDSEYCRVLGINSVDLGFRDSSMRGYTDRTELVRTVKGERKLVGMVSKRLSKVLRELSPTSILLPLALGDHVDHRIVFESVSSFQPVRSLKLYYEDLPYAGDMRLTEVNEHANCSLGSCVPISVDIKQFLNKKIQDMKIYGSQTGRHEIRAVLSHARRISNRSSACERLWMPIHGIA